jgi:hypothetical protein
LIWARFENCKYQYNQQQKAVKLDYGYVLNLVVRPYLGTAALYIVL